MTRFQVTYAVDGFTQTEVVEADQWFVVEDGGRFIVFERFMFHEDGSPNVRFDGTDLIPNTEMVAIYPERRLVRVRRLDEKQAEAAKALGLDDGKEEVEP